MVYITGEIKRQDKDWWDHIKLGDTWNTGDPQKCGVCGCESDYWAMYRWMLVPKLCLICPGNEINRDLHEKIDRKKELLYKDDLPTSVLSELRREIVHLQAQIQAEVAKTKIANAEITLQETKKERD